MRLKLFIFPTLLVCLPAVAHAEGPFGISSSAEAAGNFAKFVPLLREIGCAHIRSFGEWAGFEPRPGELHFAGEDARVKLAREQGLAISGVLAYSADWALPAGVTNRKTFPVSQLDGWAAFAKRVSERYPDVRDWEVWNEPNSPAFNGGRHAADAYAMLVKTAYDAIKAGAPEARVGLTSANFDLDFLRATVRALAAQNAAAKFDFIAVHPYELVARMLAPFGELQYLRIASNLRKMLADVAPPKRDIPLRFTELGAAVGGSSEGVDIDGNLAAVLLIKAYVLGLAQGIAELDWFEAMDAGGSQSFGLLDDDLSKRPAFTAYATMTRQLGAKPRYAGWLALGPRGDGFGFLFDAGDGPVLVAWMAHGRRASVSFGARAQAFEATSGQRVELSGGTRVLDDRPMFVRRPSDSLVTRARANLSRPFRSGATSTADANVASLSFGENVEGRGLYHDQPQTTRTLTLADGSAGALVNEHGNLALYVSVDPDFADYDTRALYLRVTARTLGPNPNGRYSGMNLFYQSRTDQPAQSLGYPYRNANAWFSVADDQQWHSAVWQLKDPLFVNTFGYAFYLGFDDSVPFVVGKIELSKVPF